jgi:type IV pilus assembly protein PilA
MQIKKKGQEGFTLIELLVVVVIIGILSSVAVPNFMGAQDKAKNSGVQANVHNVQMALEQFAVDNSGSFPTAANVITSLGTDYLGNGGRVPATPWGTQQTAAITSTASAAVNKNIGKGAKAAPTATTHYGALGYLIPASATADERYEITGSGKKGDQAITAIWVKNY